MDAAESVKWGRWTCPECGAEMEDPDGVGETCCENGHGVFLSYVDPETGHMTAWRRPDLDSKH